MPKLMLFLLIFSRFFLITFFFLLAKLFSHISCKKPLNTYQYVSYLASSVPLKYFPLQARWKNIRYFPAMGKNQNYWGGGWRSNIGGRGGCIPPGFAALCLAASWCSTLGVASDYRALCSDGTKCYLPSDRRDGRCSDRNVSC